MRNPCFVVQQTGKGRLSALRIDEALQKAFRFRFDGERRRFRAPPAPSTPFSCGHVRHGQTAFAIKQRVLVAGGPPVKIAPGFSPICYGPKSVLWERNSSARLVPAGADGKHPGANGPPQRMSKGVASPITTTTYCVPVILPAQRARAAAHAASSCGLRESSAKRPVERNPPD